MERSDPRSANASVRKRALVACELCRSKKTKCDNSRPSCESCARLRVKCLYKASNLDQSPFDFTNQAVLERLDYLVQLVETQNERNSLAAPGPSLYSPGHAAAAQTPNSNVSLDLPYTSPYAGDSCRSSAKASLEDTAILSESVDLAGQTFGMCETLLQWPIFENKYPVPGPELLVFQAEVTEKLEEKPCLSRSPNGNATQLLGSRRLIHEEDALRLAHKFLSHVHIKNPILDEHNLFDIAREVMEHGFGWDERSCLMVRLLP
jgi:Fungal Zn(2)-Cys(6) binuclear cluster domain